MRIVLNTYKKKIFTENATIMLDYIFIWTSDIYYYDRQMENTSAMSDMSNVFCKHWHWQISLTHNCTNREVPNVTIMIVRRI